MTTTLQRMPMMTGRPATTAGPIFARAFVVTSTAVALSTYLATTGWVDFASLEGVLRGLGILAGLAATNLMVLMFLTAARIPLVDRLLGQDRALEAHRAFGPWVFGLMGAHMVLLVAGYAVTDGVNIVAEVVDMFSQRDLAWAFISVGILILVGIASFAVVRRILGYEFWHLIHLATYGALLLAIPHQFSTGGVFATGIARWYWALTFAVTFGLLLTYRVFLPLVTSWRQHYTVEEVIDEASGVVSIVVRASRLADVAPRAGQFFHWRFLARGLWWHQHPFSLSAAPVGNLMRITVSSLGKGTSQLLHVKPGTKVLAQGPYGRFQGRVAQSKRLVAIGAGVGMGPIRALLDDLHYFDSAVVVQRASRAEDLLFSEEIRAMTRNYPLSYIELVGHRGRSWLPATYDGRSLADVVGPLADVDIYACGPQSWTDHVLDEARRGGVPETHIHTERFTW